MMGLDQYSQKPTAYPHHVDLIRNCDLPPPQKLFTGLDTAMVFSSTAAESAVVSDMHKNGGHVEQEKLELFKALRLSQTRAREAESKAAKMNKERDSVYNALLHEAMQVFAYRQWINLLEVQVSKLQFQLRQEDRDDNKEEEDGDNDSVSWIWAFAFCLGIGGLGFAFGC